MNIRGLDCCGAAEIIGINDSDWTPKKWLLYYNDVYSIHMERRGKAYLPFCYAWDVDTFGTGMRSKRQGAQRLKAWKKYIESNGLGEVVIAEGDNYNPNYGNTIRIRGGVFVPNDRAICKFVIAKGFRGTPAQKKEAAKWKISY